MRISKKAILEGLRALYPDAGPELHFRDPYETLVAVMLSAQCTDKQVNKVTPALFERYPTVRDMAAAGVEDVYPMVKSCGFKTKAANIVSACRLIMQNHGGEVPGSMEALTALPGVGVWTAEMILLFCLQRMDVFSYGDLGIRRGLRMLYRHRVIDRERFERYRRRFSPYGSVASLYLWAVSGGAIEGLTDPAAKER